MKLDITTKYFLEIITILFIFYSLVGMVYGQTVAPPSSGTPPASTGTPPASTGTPPATVAPTVTNVPTPTAPTPNLQYLPQKSYVQTFAPEQGIPQNGVPLQAVPPVIAPSPYQQQSNNGFDIGSIMSMVIAGGSGLLAKMGFDRAKTAQGTTQALAQTNVQQATIQQKTLEQVYENMGDKGASITNKPEIKLEEVAKMKDEALKTASKA
jgi:hypothetical protein